MFRTILLLSAAAALAPGFAFSHTGHLTDAAGHDHWIALVAIGLAAAFGVWKLLRERKYEGASEDRVSEEKGAQV